MEIWGLVAIILAIIIILAILKFVFKMVKLVFWIAVILFIITSVMGIFTYRDALDIKENLETQPKIFLLKENENIITGFSLESFDEVSEYFDSTKISAYQKDFKDKNYKEMLGENYKMFIFDKDAFDLSEKQIDFIGGKVSKQELYSVLKSNKPIEAYSSVAGTDPRVYGIENPAEFKGNIFALLFNEEFKSKGQLFILMEYKKNNVIVYPETASFKLIKLVPTSFIKNIFEKAKEKAVEKINGTIRGD